MIIARLKGGVVTTSSKFVENPKRITNLDENAFSTQDMIEYPAAGVRNILQNSDFRDGYNFWVSLQTDWRLVQDPVYGQVARMDTENIPNGIYYVEDLPHAEGETYTFSATVRREPGSADRNIYLGIAGSLVSEAKQFRVGNDWELITATIVSSGTNRKPRIYGKGVFYIAQCKLERGETRTEWTPSPEDYGLIYPPHIQQFKPYISNRVIMAEEFIEVEEIKERET